MTEIFKPSTGYKRLDVYVLANVVQLETLVFCRTFLDRAREDPCGRLFDQMTQAARSGVKNITEGSEREATSVRDTLKLFDVAKASLCELRDDYMTWLLDRGLPPWRRASPEAQEVYDVALDKPVNGDDVNYDVAMRIIATREKFAKWFKVDGARLPTTAADKLAAGVRFANAMLVLIVRSLNMLGNLMVRLGEDFRREGGFSERLTAVRVEARREARKPVDEDAPACPLCGAAMRLRHGARGDFWGCTAYPTCRGTRQVG